MSRSGYTDDCGDDDPLAMGRWRAAVKSATNGRRGQAAILEALAAFDAMEEKTLVGESLVTPEGEYCTLGVLGAARGLDMTKVDPEDWDAVAEMFNIAPALVREIVFENDEQLQTREYRDVVICGPMPPRHFRQLHGSWGTETHERCVAVDIEPSILGRERFMRMREWLVDQLTPENRAKLGKRS